MRIHRFYIDDSTTKDLLVNPGDIFVTQETELIHQIRNVFRYGVGYRFNVFNLKIGEIEVEIIKLDKNSMSFKYIRQVKESNTSDINKGQISLYMSIIKNNNYDLIIEKSVELGVKKMVPVITERTIKTDIRLDRVKKIIKESTEQSGRLDLMITEKALDFDSAIEMSIRENDYVYFGSIGSGRVDFRALDKGKAAIFIGPEGGFSNTEIDILLKKGVKPIGLGDNVLRSETAAIVGCALLS